MYFRNFKLIIVTLPEETEDEAIKIRMLLEAGADAVHIRKPHSSLGYVEQLVEDIPAPMRLRVVLHDYPDLAARYGCRFQLNSRWPEAPGCSRLSRSCHSLEEAASAKGADYVMLSPIFDSISKEGYTSKFDLDTLDLSAISSDVIALSGISLSRLPLLQSKGFAGAAMCGAVWSDEAAFSRMMKYLRMRNYRFQFITDAPDAATTIEQARQVLKGGCRWIQVRMKNASHKEVETAAREVKNLCRLYGATAIIDDNVEIAASLGMDGVHLGRNDMSVTQARNILSEGCIIGYTVNYEEQLSEAFSMQPDYLGIGPYRFTATKARLAPTIGLEGYQCMLQTMQRIGWQPPFVAIGGITLPDIPLLQEIGVEGFAISGAIGKSANPQSTTKDITKAIENPANSLAS